LTKFARIRIVCPNPTLWAENRFDGIYLVPVIAVFTKYDQYRRNIRMKLEDQGSDTDSARLNAEMERIFEKQFLAHLNGSPPFVRLESEDFFGQIEYATLISVSQRCTRRANGVLSLLRRLPMNSPAAPLPSFFWLFRRIIWSWA
jgi:hypothetical protein